jgi:allantoicase
MDVVLRAERALVGGTQTPVDEYGWATAAFDVPVLPRTRIAADARQVFIVHATDITAVRLHAHPDGGIARVRWKGAS